MTTSLASGAVGSDSLDDAIDAARRALLRLQQPDGHWRFELEADATIPAEYVMLGHFTGEVDRALERKLCAYLRRRQNAEGGWPLYHGGRADISATVKAYFALKLAGDSAGAPHMVRARELILARGGAARCNVFTRIALALFGQVPWRAVPAMPVEMIHLPRWFPFHLDKISYWSRVVVVPLLVLMAIRPLAKNASRVDVRELFVTDPARERNYMRAASASPFGRALLAVDALIRRFQWLSPRFVRARALAQAMRWTLERLNGEDGLGAIFPAMANSLMALDAMGYAKDDPVRAVVRRAIDNLLVVGTDEAYCQPCVSPVWDTSLTIHALLEDGDAASLEAAARGNDWLEGRQITTLIGDWAVQRPGLRAGGWAFQYWNDHYPDVDDTAAVAMAMHRGDAARYGRALERAAEWVVGMQSSNGGWGAFDAENEHYFLNHIPFADHGALLDPPTEDVSARCVGMLVQMGYALDHPAVARGLAYLRRTQQADGSWYGRWGTNYIYGTWSTLNAFMAVGETARNSTTVRRAVAYVERMQRADGGWGEDGSTYWSHRRGEAAASTASQTAWAILALLSAGELASPAISRGIAYLQRTQNADGVWDEEAYTAVGFPRVFYLRYHGYRAFFPLFALARYRNRRAGIASGTLGF